MFQLRRHFNLVAAAYIEIKMVTVVVMVPVALLQLMVMSLYRCYI